MSSMATKAHIAEAVRLLGSKAALAKACGVSRQAIGAALVTGNVGGPMAVAIETATHGAITRAMIRPDLWGPDAQA